MKALAPNTLLQNRYLVVQLIGKGGMGEVYLAVDQRLGSPVALKRTFFSDDEMLGNAFEREARTLARLRHPVLPKVSDHFTENETQYLAMEHISGDDLSKRLELTDKPFPLSWVLFWSDQLLDALAYLHSYEPPIIHRDIKPQNLKLTDENHIVLLDFGLAKNSIGNTRVTSTGGSVVGYTPHYAPMEQIRGTGTDPRSDLYSLSATVYQLLTNTVPPDALTRADSILNGLPDPIKPLDKINPEIPKTISDVILKGMSLSMDQRYTDAREMQKVLREAYAGMQNTMSAQTVAFNKSDVQSAPPENLSAAGDHASEQNNYQPQTGNLPASGAPDSFLPAAQNYDSPNNFDPPVKDAEKSTNIKTEVLPHEKIPRADDYAASLKQEKESGTNDFSIAPPAEDFSSSADAGEKGFDPHATVPLINFGKAAEEGESIDSSPENEKIAAPSKSSAAARDFAVAETAAVAPEQETFEPTPVKTAPPKKSGGKSLAIAAGVGGFAVIIIAAAALVWYVLKPTTSPVEPTSAPTVESTPAPSAAPTEEPTLEANTSVDNSSQVTAESSPESDTNPRRQDVSGGGGRTQNDRTGRTTSRVVVSTAATPVPPGAEAAKPTPTKKPVAKERTILLQ